MPPSPLRVAVAFVVTIAGVLPAFGQTPPTTPSFEVASIKLNRSGTGNWEWKTDRGGRMTASNVPLLTLLRDAYDLQESQLIGVPNWMQSASYDIVAKGEGDPSDEQIMLMLQALFSERFKLGAHRELRELPIYALVVSRSDAKAGPQLVRSSINCDELERTKTPPPPAPPATTANPRPVQPCSASFNAGSKGATLTAGAISMTRLAKMLPTFVNRIVLDRTGLAGGFDIHLTWTPNQTADTAGPSVFTALEEQLGLKLESARGPVEVLVIDHLEQPTPD